MKIIKLSIKGYIGLGFWKSDKLGKLNRITGGNGVGKSSLLKAIKEAFKSSGNDPELIRIGEDKAEIYVWLDTGIEIQRKITPSSNTVKVVKDDQPLDSPQKFLNSLIGGFQFNPIDFLMAKTKQRREILLSAMPFHLDPEKLANAVKEVSGAISFLASAEEFNYSKHGLEVLSDIQKWVYDRRHEQGIEVDQLKKSIRQDRQDIPETLDTKKFKDFDLNAKIEERSNMQAEITGHEKDLVTLANLRNRAEQIDNEVTLLENQIIKLKSERAEVSEKGKALKAETDKFKSPDTESIKEEIVAYQEFQGFSIRLEAIQAKEDLLGQADEIRTSLDDLYKALTNEIPKKLLAEIKLPIKELEIKGDKILIKGVELDKLSDSEQIRFSVELARSLTGDLKVICIDRFETLDTKSREIFEKMASGDSFEYFITEVTDGDLQMDSKNGQVPEPVEEKAKGKVDF